MKSPESVMAARRPFFAAAAAAAIALAAASAGCVDVLTGREVPETRFYSLDPRLPERPSAEPQPVALRVERVEADPTARRIDLVLRKREPSQEVVPFLYHRWVAMPDVFVGERLREHLFATGLFARVVAAGEKTPCDFRLESRLTRLEGVETESGTEGVIVLEIALFEASGDERECFRHRVEKRSPAAGSSPADIADALAAALRDLLDDVARRVDFGIRSVRS